MFAPPLYQVLKLNLSIIFADDFKLEYSKEDLQKYKVNQQDNQLFRQVRLITGDNRKFNKYVIFVDGRGLQTKPELFEELVIKGFYLNGVHFEFGERSPSMTRNAILSFVDSSIAKELDTRITMGIEFDKTVLAKYVGYRGLMFSSCHCFENWIPKVIIVPDYYTVLKNQNIKYVVDETTEFKDKETGKMIQWTQKGMRQGQKDIKINAFDGCGIHHPDIGNEIWNKLGCYDKPTSVMWRAPYIKGVTHEFNYTEFFNERGVKTIKDVWGIEHDVNDKMIIMTESMFKGMKYFNKYKSIEDWNFYWKQFKKYNHCFGVAKWNFTKKEEPLYTRGNYQILQDLDLSYNDFRDLADYTIEWITNVVGEDIRYTYCFLGMMADNRNPRTDQVKAILRNPDMIKEKGVREHIVEQLKKYIDDSKCGKLYLNGTFKFLVPDLVALCEHIGGLEVNGCLESTEMYSNNINGTHSGEYLIERNPHICRSEHTILNAVSNELTEKWLSHLSNVCVINIKSLTPQRLNGADFDGDLVLVINNPIMIKGVDRNCPIVIDVEDKITTLSEEYTKENLLKLVIRSTNSLIGETSNCATTYHNKQASTKEQKDKYESYIDLLSVINGKAIKYSVALYSNVQLKTR